MRKQVLFGSLIALAGTAGAQVTITSADQPHVFQVYHQAQDTTGSQNPGPSGPSQTYTMTLLNQGIDSLTFTAPQWTAYGANYPQSNLCIIQNQNDGFIYANMTNTVLEINGQAADPFGNGTIALTFSNPETQMIFPAAYGGTFSDVAGGVNQFYMGYDPGIGFPVDSARIHTYISKEANFDGWGTITSPLGTFNVLRQNTERTQVDTIDIYVFGMWTNAIYSQQSTSRIYSYWTNGIGFPVVELTDDGDQGQISDATWLQRMPTVTNVTETANDNTVTAYPNPAADVLTIQTSVDKGSIELIDMSGRVVKTVMINSKVTRVNVADLAAGMYTYRVTGTNEHGKVQVAR